MRRRYKHYQLYGVAFTSKRKAKEYRNREAKQVADAKNSGSPINLKFRVLKIGSRYIVTKESLRK